MVAPLEPRDPQSDPASLERDLERFETDLRQLELEYTMFFAGQRPRPPLESQARVEAIVRRWDRVPIEGSTARFRLQHAPAAVPDLRRPVGSRAARTRRGASGAVLASVVSASRR